MDRSRRSAARRRALTVLTVGATVASGAALLGPGTSSASSHREAPYTASDPQIDNTDVYAFTSPDKPDTATVIANWQPFQEPAGGPNFYPWATDAAYDVNVDNNGDAKPDVTYRWTFANVDRRGAVQHGDKVGGTFLYNDGPVTSLSDTNFLFRQVYNLDKITYDAAGAPTTTRVLTRKIVAPSNVGKASIPNYAALRQAAVSAGQIGSGGQSYVGQADDPFFLDLRVFDLLYGTNLKEAGHDTLSGYNVNTIALQIPKKELAGNADPGKNPVVGIWSTTSRQTTRVLPETNAAPGDATSSGNLAQVSRLGNPLVNEVVVPANLKDFFNRSTPDKDAQFAGKVTDPELPYLIQGIYKIPNPNTTAGGKNRPDLVAAFLTGLSKKAAAGTTFGGLAKGSPAVDLNSLDLNANNASPAPAEYLRLNLNTPVTARPNRLGVLGGDVQGFPNGRRLADDVLDIALQATEGVLVPDQPKAVKTAVMGLGDGVNANDRPFLSSFPYVADPNSGSTPRNRKPVNFHQSFTSRSGYVMASAENISPAQPGSAAVLYQVDSRGQSHYLGTARLNAAGTAIVNPARVRSADATMTLYWTVLTPGDSNVASNSGIQTRVTVVH